MSLAQRTADLRNAPIEESTAQGGRAYQQDAYFWTRASDAEGNPFLIGTIADGCGAGQGSAAIADDAVVVAAQVAAVYGPTGLDKAVTLTGNLVRERHRTRGEKDNTTLTVVTVDRFGAVRVAWVGDSRCYALTSDERLHRLTQDHNLAAFGKPGQLTRSLLGPFDHDCYYEPDVCTEHAPATASRGGQGARHAVRRLLLCTDGVCGPLSDEQIRHILLGTPDPARAAKRLTTFAVRAAGAQGTGVPDNATALVIDLRPGP